MKLIKIGILGNRTRTLRTPSNMMVVALALSDFIMICTMAPPLFINVFMGKYWAFGPLMCKLYGFLGGVFGEEARVCHACFIFLILLNAVLRLCFTMDDHHDWL